MREVKDGDRARLSDTDIVGRVKLHPDVAELFSGGTVYRVPPSLLVWEPPDDDPEFTVGSMIRDADQPDGMCWWYLPDRTSDQPFISVMRTANGDPRDTWRRYWRRDELPAHLAVAWTPDRDPCEYPTRRSD